MTSNKPSQFSKIDYTTQSSGGYEIKYYTCGGVDIRLPFWYTEADISKFFTMLGNEIKKAKKENNDSEKARPKDSLT